MDLRIGDVLIGIGGERFRVTDITPGPTVFFVSLDAGDEGWMPWAMLQADIARGAVQLSSR